LYCLVPERKKIPVQFQVETNIGTLVNIRIRTNPRYIELMNIDIVMAPKDYASTEGLCGTFDSNKHNDFHDRDGTVLSDRLQFINSWKYEIIH
jgi:hypothetical protein